MADLVSPYDMTGNTSPAPFVASASSEYTPGEAYYGFKPDLHKSYLSSGAPPAWLQLDMGAGNAKIVGSYSISAADNNVNRTSSDWTLLGSNNGSDWDILDSVTGETGWALREKRTFDCDVRTTAYRYFRINITAVDGGPYVYVSYLELWEFSPNSIPLSICKPKQLKIINPFPIIGGI